MKTTETKPARISGRYRTADGKAMIEWELEPKENGLEFSACGDYDGGGGQNIDTIARAYPKDEKVQRIARVWERYHLNGMNAGIPAQRAEIERREQLARKKYPAAVYPDGSLNWYKLAELSGLKKEQFSTLGPGHYELVLHWLKRARLYEIPIHQEIMRGELKATGGFPPEVITGARGYRYGERWVFNPIPEDVQAEIRSWADWGPDDGKSLGDHLTAEFLKRNGIACDIRPGSGARPSWAKAGEPSGRHYRISLRGENRLMVFDFWGSIRDREEGKDPGAHAIFSCIASDIHMPDTFREYLSEFGGEDTPEQRDTFRRIAKHCKELREFFSVAERKQLQELR